MEQSSGGSNPLFRTNSQKARFSPGLFSISNKDADGTLADKLCRLRNTPAAASARLSYCSTRDERAAVARLVTVPPCNHYADLPAQGAERRSGAGMLGLPGLPAVRPIRVPSSHAVASPSDISRVAVTRTERARILAVCGKGFDWLRRGIMTNARPDELVVTLSPHGADTMETL